MPMKLASGCSTAEEMRKRPLPDPISRMTGLALPKSCPKSRRARPVWRGLMTSRSSVTRRNDRRSRLPQRRALHHPPDVVHQLRLPAQPPPYPANEPDVLLREVALATQMVEPAVGVSVEDADQHLESEKVSRR